MFDKNLVKTHMHKDSKYAMPPEIILTHYIIGSRGTEQRKLVRMPSSFWFFFSTTANILRGKLVCCTFSIGFFYLIFFAVALIISQNFRPWEFCQKMLITIQPDSVKLKRTACKHISKEISFYNWIESIFKANKKLNYSLQKLF